MTAQVVVLNKYSLAMASDSASTIVQPGGRGKLIAMNHKLHKLSNHAPIGIMTSGGAQFMEIPWPAIIDLYRSRPGSKTFDSVVEYGQDFIGFLLSEPKFFDETREEALVCRSLYYLFEGIKSEVWETIAVEYGDRRTSVDERGGVVSSVIERHCTRFQGANPMNSGPTEYFD